MKHNNIYIFLIAIFLLLTIFLIVICVFKFATISLVEEKQPINKEQVIEEPQNQIINKPIIQQDPLITPAR
ncbi:hypothetical protein HOC90_04240 [Candidatus Falkowbacteria bacterium]|jgi:hypothetical protein|nr:hypothetical protein [Candidatus Falkowbacteria bacterium]